MTDSPAPMRSPSRPAHRRFRFQFRTSRAWLPAQVAGLRRGPPLLPMLTSSPVAFITGAGRRIGAAIARTLAAAGYRLVLHCNDSRKEAEALVDELGGPGRAEVLQGDLTDAAFCALAISQAVECFGRLDLLVNNASRYTRLPLIDTSLDEFQRLFFLNCFAPIELMREFAALGTPGCIVNLLDARIAKIDHKAAAYHLAKQTLAEATRMAALAWAKQRLRVNGVAPGLVRPAEGVPLSRMAHLLPFVPLGIRTPEEQVASAVRFLAENDVVTGEILYLDGGLHLADASIGEKQ